MMDLFLITHNQRVGNVVYGRATYTRSYTSIKSCMMLCYSKGIHTPAAQGDLDRGPTYEISGPLVTFGFILSSKPDTAPRGHSHDIINKNPERPRSLGATRLTNRLPLKRGKVSTIYLATDRVFIDGCNFFTESTVSLRS